MFNREMRYLVFKHKDVFYYLTREEQAFLFEMAQKITQGRVEDAKSDFECVVVESDWPEYEPVWKMIEQRCGGDDGVK